MRPERTRIFDRSARLAGVLLALVAPAMAGGMRFLPGKELGPPYLLFGPPILLAAMLAGPWAGVLSTAVSAALSADWVLSTGRGWSRLAPQEAVGLGAFVVSGLLVSLLSHLHRRARDRAAAAEQAAAVRESAARLEDSEARLQVTRRDAEMSEQRFRALIEKSTDMILVLDADGSVTFLSPSATETMGWGAGEALGRPLQASVHPDDRERGERMLERLRQQPGARQQAVLRHAHADGTWRQLALDARNLLDDPAVRGVVVNARDISAQLALEQELQQAQRLESLGRLAGGVAHDFNNLLTVVLAGVEELRHSPSDPRAVAEIAGEIETAGGHARELTQHLLAFSRRQVVAPVLVDLGAVVEGVEKLLRRLLGEGVTLATGLAPGLWPVRCDRGQVERIVVNLAVNARDAMPSGGRLTIETTNVEVPDDGRAPRSGPGPGPWVRLSVIDEGEGMAPSVQAQIFEPFFTTKAKGKGTGLGLSTVYGIVTQSGGFVRVDSAPGRGTRFDVLLPRALPDPVEAAARAEPAPGGGCETILLVEDDAQVMTAAGRTLRGAGYQVHAAAGGEEALQVAAAVPGRIDLVLTDVVMPGLGGPAVAERLRGQRPGLPVLFISGYAPEALSRGGTLEPGAAFLAKPFSPASLLAAVRASLDAASPSRPPAGDGRPPADHGR